jgi:hypothetical protein
MSRESQNREEEVVSVDLHWGFSGSASCAAVVERRHLLHDYACTDKADPVRSAARLCGHAATSLLSVLVILVTQGNDIRNAPYLCIRIDDEGANLQAVC